MISLGRLEEIKDLRTVWAHEALDFTPWLAEEDNIAILGDAIGLDIAVEEKESNVGDFNVDIYATEAGTGKKIIIENQLEDTNHDHLGKLITYASGKSAEFIIWVVKNARAEHRSAIEWLNNHTDDEISFFLCEIKLFKIGNSDIAVKFEVVEKPNNWVKAIKKEVSNSPAKKCRYDYWVAFNEYVFNNSNFSKNFSKRKATNDHWMNLSIGSSDCSISINQVKKRSEIEVEIYIYENKDLFLNLFSNKESIENNLGFKLDWRELPERKASRIIISKHVDFGDKNHWNEQFEWIMDTCIKMKIVFRKYL